MVALALFALGLTMLCEAAARQPTHGPILDALATTAETTLPTAAPDARRPGTARRGLASPTASEQGRSTAKAPRPPRMAATGADTRDDLLALAALQRRWGLPSRSYATGAFGS
jgi:hypothetical protein